MCGIAGFVGGFIPGLMARMNSAQAHRGPDGSGVFEDSAAEVALGHVRLAILDLSALAAQPMHSPDSRFVLTYNGEIYNFPALRQELESKGVQFKSRGDSEVLLHGLAHYGEEFLQRLNGMFAFALWDRRERELILARDPLGIKPLYYAQPATGTLLFASEIKALCAHPTLPREPNFDSLQQHLCFGHASGEQTALKAVKRLLPGSILRWKAGLPLQRRRYWRPIFSGTQPASRAAGIETFRTALNAAVSRQLVSDVPVGSFLSGGLDSSVVTALAAKKIGHSFQCFTIRYPDTKNVLDHAQEDLRYARSLAATLKLPLHEIELKADAAALWPSLVYHLDEPIADPAAISCYLISKLAREHGTPVLLSGQGADELLCGYPRYRVMDAAKAMEHLPSPLRRAMAAVSKQMPASRPGKSGLLLRRARRVMETAGLGSDARFLNLCASTAPGLAAQALSAEARASLADDDATAACLNYMISSGLSGLERYIDRDLFTYLPNHNLLYTDKMGMAVGLEARVPLLDQPLVEQANALPLSWKFSRGKTKVVLRQAARGLVSDEIIDRPKAGFGAPFRKWLRDDLADMWNDLCGEKVLKRRGWFDEAHVGQARERSLSGKDDLYMLQWAVLTSEIWAREFIDRNPSHPRETFHPSRKSVTSGT